LKTPWDAQRQLLHRSYGKASSGGNLAWHFVNQAQHSDGTQGANYSVNTRGRTHTQTHAALVGVYFNMQRQHVVPSKTGKFILYI